jgi:secondary thiamine-phosphate synthase enzyme
MRQQQTDFTLRTGGQGFYEITDRAAAAVSAAAISTGLVSVFCRHTSCSLILNENADPGVRRDLAWFLRRLVPDGDPGFVHRLEGPDDMAAHIKTALTASSIVIPVAAGRLALGTWQGLYLFEHRTAPRRMTGASCCM